MNRPTVPALPSWIPFLVACVGIAIFAGMDAIMKGLVLTIGTYNAMLWRSFANVVFSGSLYVVRRDPPPSRVALRLHLLRGVLIAPMAVAFFWGIGRVPLAEAVAVSFIAPLIALYLAAVLLGEKIGREAIIASLMGIGGVAVIVASKFQGDYSEEALWGIAAILGSAVLYAWNLILQRQQAQVASPVEIALFLNLTVCAIVLVAAPFWAVIPPTTAWPGIIGAALCATVSVLLLSWAYARAEAQILLPVEYTAFVWAALMGWLFFDEQLTAATLIGTALIVAGCIIAARRKPAAAAQLEVTTV